jgi:hypothetical protein
MSSFKSAWPILLASLAIHLASSIKPSSLHTKSEPARRGVIPRCRGRYPRNLKPAISMAICLKTFNRMERIPSPHTLVGSSRLKLAPDFAGRLAASV